MVRGSHGAPLIGYNNNPGIRSWSNYGSSWSAAPRVITRSRAPVVIYQNNYFNRSGSVTSRLPSQSDTSLLRDVQGRCFEREYDSRGNEMRTELPSSACNF